MSSLNNKERLFTIFKRFDLSKKRIALIRAISVTVGILLSVILCSIVVKDNIFKVLGTIIKGNTIDIWKLLFDTGLLLAFGVAIIAPFKMKYWNMGAGGAVLMSGLSSYYLIFKLSPIVKTGKLSNIVLLIIMLICGIIAGVIWSVIPAIFKAFFNTNETLFTLMMNYIAAGLVAYVNYIMASGKKINPGIISYTIGTMPSIVNTAFIPLIIIAVITVLMSIYLNKTKHGYEVSVLGDSSKTARYVGMHNKWITIRTLILSGVICGIIGFIYVACKDHMCSETTGGSLGFTGILVAWISNFNTPIMAVVSLLLSFLSIGTSKVSSVYNVGNSQISNISLGLVFFTVLIGEFIINYRIKINIKRNKEVE